MAAPSRFQYLLAGNWHLRIYFTVACLLGAWTIYHLLKEAGAGFTGVLDILLLAACMALGMGMAFYLALLVAFMPFSFFHFWRARVNGAPFAAGDTVRILAGPHRDRIFRIYQIWAERGQVRVELEAGKKECSDVFSYLQVCRERSATGLLEQTTFDQPS